MVILGDVGRKRWATAFGAALLVLPLAAAQAHHRAAEPALPRAKTLYTSGTATSAPTNFNPLDLAQDYTGTQGLLYEPLFLYDPVRGQFIPWLATNGTWAGPRTYKLQIRDGVSWAQSSTGSATGALTGADVAYSVNLAMRDKADPYYGDVTSVKSASAVGDTVTVSFNQPVD